MSRSVQHFVLIEVRSDIKSGKKWVDLLINWVAKHAVMCEIGRDLSPDFNGMANW